MLFASVANALAAATTATAAAAPVAASTITGVAATAGLALTGAGVATQVIGQQQAAAASRRMEDIRERQMALAAIRERREVIRRAQASRSIALANATVAGAQDSSVLPGAIGHIGSQAAMTLNANAQGFDLGQEMFQANRDAASAGTVVGIGTGVKALGTAVASEAPRIGTIGSTLFGTP